MVSAIMPNVGFKAIRKTIHNNMTTIYLLHCLGESRKNFRFPCCEVCFHLAKLENTKEDFKSSVFIFVLPTLRIQPFQNLLEGPGFHTVNVKNTIYVYKPVLP